MAYKREIACCADHCGGPAAQFYPVPVFGEGVTKPMPYCQMHLNEAILRTVFGIPKHEAC